MRWASQSTLPQTWQKQYSAFTSLPHFSQGCRLGPAITASNRAFRASPMESTHHTGYVRSASKSTLM